MGISQHDTLTSDAVLFLSGMPLIGGMPLIECGCVNDISVQTTVGIPRG